MPEGGEDDGFERFTREQAAAVALRGRIAAVETRVAAVAVFLSVVVGFLGLAVEISWLSQHGFHGRRRGGLGFLVPALVIAAIARLVSRRMVEGRREAWVAELAEEPRIAPDALRDAIVG